jgi:hypothetical protein
MLTDHLGIQLANAKRPIRVAVVVLLRQFDIQFHKGVGDMRRDLIRPLAAQAGHDDQIMHVLNGVGHDVHAVYDLSRSGPVIVPEDGERARNLAVDVGVSRGERAAEVGLDVRPRVRRGRSRGVPFKDGSHGLPGREAGEDFLNDVQTSQSGLFVPVCQRDQVAGRWERG